MSNILPFVEDDDLFECVSKLLVAAENAAKKVDENPYKNVIDPFSALVDAAIQNISLETWMKQEKARQMQKSFQNAVGDFHQGVIGCIHGWENAGKGGSYDVINQQKKIIAEIKNKYNTMNSTTQLGTYDKMASWLDYGKPGYQAFVVEIVPKTVKSYSLPFIPPERKIKRQTRNNLRRIDGKSFYALASGYDEAINMLYDALPTVIARIIKIDSKKLKESSPFFTLFEKAYGERIIAK